MVVLIVIIALSSALSAQTNGSVSGAVIDRDSKAALAGASILVVGHQTNGAPTFFAANSGADGTYAIPSVNQGEYTVCGHYEPPLPSGSRRDFWQTRANIEEEVVYVNSCESGGVSAAAVTSGQFTANIQLERGVKVSVRVDDPANLLDRASPTAVDVQINVLDASGHVRAALPMRSNSGGVRLYTAILSRGTGYTLQVRTQGASLFDKGSSFAHPPNLLLPIQTGTHSILAAHFKLQK